jgi:hypothetical protein
VSNERTLKWKVHNCSVTPTLYDSIISSFQRKIWSYGNKKGRVIPDLAPFVHKMLYFSWAKMVDC